jgi:hypothetical protein
VICNCIHCTGGTPMPCPISASAPYGICCT